MSLRNVVGWQIRKIRIAKGMTVAQLSSALPKSSPLSCEELVRIELANQKVYDHQILAISQALGVRISDLFATPPRKRRAKKGPQ